MEYCNDCNGLGLLSYNERNIQCITCNGSGKINNNNSNFISEISDNNFVVNIYNKNYPSPINKGILKKRIKDDKLEYYIELDVLKNI